MKPNFELNSRAHRTWLTAVFILVLAQTWPLRAQTPPALEPVMLQAKRALRMTFPSRTGEKYQVWQSQDLKTWEKYGHVIDGTGAEIVLVHVTDDPRQLSFRAESLRGQIVEVAKELLDFKTYPSWRLVRTLLGPDPFLGDAHGGGQFFRSIYVSPSNAKLVDGQFPAGTIVVKELRTNDNGKPGPITEALTIMVKRGAAFDAAGNNWEYFMANPELTQTMLRGSSSSMCFGCHGAVKNLDYVFSVPALTP